ncbi:MAG: hypothetical protein LBD64_02695 [Odoribacteraceae bacterium]|nr:hypothetical protein [Odoribacteraceae bacterium]
MTPTGEIDYQMLVTCMVVALALFLLARRAYRLARGRCNGCHGCGNARKKKHRP